MKKTDKKFNHLTVLFFPNPQCRDGVKAISALRQTVKKIVNKAKISKT